MKQETPTIKATPRPQTGSRQSQRLRESGRLPGIIYGHKRDPFAISMDEKEILTLLHHGAHVMKIDVEGGKTETCLIKDLQFGYLGDNVIHIDFNRVKLDEEVHVNVRLTFVGESPAMQKAGAILNQDLNELEVVCKVNTIPEEIRVDLARMEDMLTVGDIELPPGVRAAVEPETPVARISFAREEEPAAEEVEVAAEAAEEPEVITEAKAEKEKEKEEEGES
ncbi:MAG: 50S ribosomal protein L25 [Planctomycetota bacterium]|jgi:large subunit ribosomal protein L25